jgi:23S rRNA pseudouridine1911/1915/1917 synthase
MKRLFLRVGPHVKPGTRVDKYLAGLPGLGTRSQLKNALRCVTHNGKPAKVSSAVQPGDSLEIWFAPPAPPDYAAEKIELDIVYEDSRVIVVNKPRGMVVHPGSGVAGGTLVQGLLYHVRGLAESFPGEKIRPGIVHRLDRDTSGVIAAAKDPRSLEYLANQFRGRLAKKLYLAIVRGRLPETRGIIAGHIRRDPRRRKRFVYAQAGGKPAETRYRVLAECGGYSLVRLAPKTGRTHQLRVHMKALGCPILGDPLYGKPDERLPGCALMLHARALSLVLPGEETRRTFKAPLPGDFSQTLRCLFPDGTPLSTS